MRWQQPQHATHMMTVFSSFCQVYVRSVNKHLKLICQAFYTDGYCTAKSVNQKQEERKNIFFKTMPKWLSEQIWIAPLKLKSDKTPHNLRLCHFQPLIEVSTAPLLTSVGGTPAWLCGHSQKGCPLRCSHCSFMDH